METYIGLHRGINVGGHRKIKMTDLKALYQDLGFGQVATYIQSGNVVFRSAVNMVGEIEAEIGKEIKAKFGYGVPTMVRPLSYWNKIIDDNPFLGQPLIDINWLHVSLLDKVPNRDFVVGISQKSYGNDLFSVVGDAVYVCCPNGYGKTKLNNNFFEQKLKQPATTRNWKTVGKLQEMARVMG